MSRAWLRWVPAAAVSAAIAAGVLVGSIPARAGDPLPEKSPADVLALVGQHTTRTFSGTVEQSAELGLPALPGGAPTSGPVPAGGAASVIELLTGEHTARIFMDGPARMRIQVMDRLAERDIIRRDGDVWFYNSKDNSAAHLSLPAFANDLPLPAPPLPVPGGLALHGTDPQGPALPAPELPVTVLPTPEDLARKVLAAVDSSTAVTVGPDVEVAGRSAYSLVLTPRTQGTLVEKAVIAVDGETGMPLRVSVAARGQTEPAFEAGFTSLTLAAPEDAVFMFAPPPGATVKELTLPQVPGGAAHLRDRDAPSPTVTGKGWETVIGFPAAPGGQGASMAESLLKDPLLSQAAVVVPGGRLLSTSLVNVLIADDGRIFVGMVPAERLQAVAGLA